MASQIQIAFQKPYEKSVFIKDILFPIFTAARLQSFTTAIDETHKLSTSEAKIIKSVAQYGLLTLDDDNEIKLYEIKLQPNIQIEYNKIGIQNYIRKTVLSGEAVLVNFVQPNNLNTWRFSFIESDAKAINGKFVETKSNPKRYTYIVGQTEICKTVANRMEVLQNAVRIVLRFSKIDEKTPNLLQAFSVETLSTAFFDEYTLHYKKFVNYLDNSNYRKSVFDITHYTNATQKEIDNANKPIRDFAKKMLGRIVFLYFVQKKGWLGATNIDYIDGSDNFIFQLFEKSGANENFYHHWLSKLFFETLNKQRIDDVFVMPDNAIVKVPYLNGGLFDPEEYDNKLLTFIPTLFHSDDFEGVILTDKLFKKNDTNHRGFLDFLNSFNFTVYEDSPEDHTVAVDPEMLGHIFENLLEDNKDKGAFYTPKEIVHYMCQESLIEYLTTHLSKEYTVYRAIGNQQVEMFGNEIAQGQLQMMESLGDKALDREAIASIVKNKDISSLTAQQLTRMSDLLNTVKICDPAIGSGAFPMGLLQEIFALKELIAFETNSNWEPAKVKENIIQNSIYGVDVEKGAVDIARLRFWLSLIVNEEKPKALPNLDYKIVVGDSLLSKFAEQVIDIDWDIKDNSDFQKKIRKSIEELIDAKKVFFELKKEKVNAKKDIRTKTIDLLINILTFDKEKYFKEYSKTKSLFEQTSKEKKEQADFDNHIYGFDKAIKELKLLKTNSEKFEFFDWRIDFAEILNENFVEDINQKGFDIVIGNPPYISFYSNTGINLSVEEKKFIARTYNSVEKENDRINTMNLFSEKGIKLIKKNGNLSYIVNKTMGVLPSYSYFRKYIIENVKFNYSITNLTPFKAIVDCFIFSLENIIPNKEYLFRFYKGNIENFTKENINTFKKNNNLEFHIPENDKILNLIDNAPFNLCDILTINRGVNIGGCFDIFLSENKLTNRHNKYLSGTKCIKQYSYDWDLSDGYMVFDRLNEKKLRADGKTLALGNHERFLQNRIFIPESAQIIMAAYSEELIYSAYGILVGTSINKDYLKYACGLLNSKVITFYCIQKEILRKGNKATPHIGVKGLNSIPIYINNELILFFSKIIDFIIFLKQQSNSLISTYFEQIIDGMVYELYFSEVLKQHKCTIIEYLGELPAFIDKMDDSQKIEIINTVFSRLNEKNHPVRVNLFYMKAIPEIKIIEGIKEE